MSRPLSPPSSAAGPSPEFLAGGGAAGALMRALDWSTTPLGPPDRWPPALTSAVSICLNARFPICIYWGDELTLLYNDAWSPIPGAKHPWALGRTAREVWSDIWDLIDPVFRQVLSTGEGTFQSDALLPMHRHGYTEECYFDYTFSPICGPGGGVAGVFNAVTETTYRVINARRSKVLRDLSSALARAKRPEDVCAQAAESLDAATYDVPFSLLYLVAPDGREAVLAGAAGIARGSPAAPAVVSLAAEDDGGWPVARAVRSAEAEAVDNLHRLFDPLPGGAWPEPATQALVLPIVAPGRGGVTAVVVAGVSPRRALDDDYRSFFQLLTGHVAAALSNARAYEEERRRAEKLAELDRAKTAFFSNVSHEFRTPLTLMLGPLEDVLAPGNEVSPPNRALLATVQRNGQRLLKLVNSLLDFARIEAGRVQASFAPTDLAAFTAELASVFRAAVEKAGLRLVVDCPPLPAPVYVDRDMWEKVVLNLVSNAFKFTFEGEIRVRLRAEGGRAVLAVEDTGTGIPAHEVPNLFNRFHRVEGAAGRTHEGTGIGLALVQELVKLHGGDVTVESAAGAGSTFTVALPFGTGHLPADRVAATGTLSSASSGTPSFVGELLRWVPEDAPPVGPHDLPGADARVMRRETAGPRARVLLADDNADMREYVSRLLAAEYDVVAVSDGQAALAEVRLRPVDIVVTDVMMPKVDGFGLLKALRSDPTTASVPVVMLSARAGEEARVEGLEAGADDYLVKPFSARELLARVGGTLLLARTRVEAARREAALRAETVGVLESIADGFVELGTDWRFTYANAAAERIVGMSRTELLGKNQWELFPATLGTHNEEAYRRTMAERVPTHFEYHYPPEDRWLEIDVYPVQGAGIGVYFRNITERKRAAERDRGAAATNAKFRALFEQSAQFAGILTTDGTVVEVNRLFLDACGFVAADVVGKPFWECGWWSGSPELRTMVQAACREAATGRVFRRESAFCTAGGGDRVMDFVLSPVTDDAGRVLFLATTGVDVTDRKRAESALRAGEERFRAFMDHSPTAAWVTDTDGRVLYVSAAYTRMFEVPRHDVVGASPFDLYPDEFAREYMANIRRVAETGRALETLERAPRADGSVGHFLVYKFPLPGTTNVGGVAVDISERLRAEEQLREADRKKDEFLALLAHELRNPLAPLRNGLQVLRLSAAGETESAARARAMMDRQLAHMVRLIDDLLDVSRISRNKLSLRRERLDLSDVVAAAVETARPAVEAGGHGLAVELPAQTVPVDADLTRLAQVFSNLLTNAAKYTPPGGRIRLAAEVRGDQVAVSVTDNGIGIPVESLPKIFDMFSQVDRSIERATGGLGIGLALVKGLVEMHGGSVEAESGGDTMGSTFTVLLPLAAPAIRPSDAPKSEPPSAPAIRRRVLVVDDNRDSAESMGMMLSLLGGETQVAYDGIEAVAAAEAFKPEVILMDVGMPRLNGLDATRRIRKHTWGHNITIVALTGWGQEDDRERSRAAGCDGHLVKPVALSDLERLLKSLRPDEPSN